MLFREPLDLGALMPEVWALEKAAWLQSPFAEAEPVGAPWWPCLCCHVRCPSWKQPPPQRVVPTREWWVGETNSTSPWNHPFPIVQMADAEPAVQRAWGELVERMQAEYERQLEEAAAIREMLPLRTGLRLIPDQLVVIRTDYGEITVQMRWDAAPHTAEHFLKLSQNGYYRDDLPPDRPVHRQR